MRPGIIILIRCFSLANRSVVSPKTRRNCKWPTQFTMLLFDDCIASTLITIDIMLFWGVRFSVTAWPRGYRSNSGQTTTCCLMAPNHYLSYYYQLNPENHPNVLQMFTHILEINLQIMCMKWQPFVNDQWDRMFSFSHRNIRCHFFIQNT